jgi:hypothetical protein
MMMHGKGLGGILADEMGLGIFMLSKVKLLKLSAF